MPFEVPDGWKSVPVSELFCLNPKSEITDDTSVGFIPMACVNDGFSGNHQFEKRIWKEVKKGYCHFQNGDIGIAKISPCFENLKSTIFQNLPNNYGAGTTELVILRPLNIHAKFYLYLFKSQWYISEGTKYFKGVVGQQRVHKGIFTDLQIPLPPLTEQYRIVAEIEKWFALIDQIEQGKADLQTAIKQTKSKILDLAIHGKLVPQDPNDEPASELLKRINPKVEITCDNAHYGKLPDRWCLTKLGAIGRWQSGGTPSRANSEYYVGDIPWLKIADLQDGYVKECSEKISNEAICNSSAKINPEGSIALAMYGSIGKLGILTFPAATNQAICVCSSFMGVDAKYLFFFLMSQRDDFVLKAGGGVQANISKEIIINHRIAIPPLPEQLRIVSKIENLFFLLNDIESSLQA